ncbi:hypothetical protein [Nonomuraea sp. NPDC050691]|uniref:hypothetical protein n=1 Tax=Nonomuraea sp. NPDC050691 TaxID=3155661 RepID=UPI0033EA54AA
MQETTPFILAGEQVNFPTLANGTAIKNAARRYESAFELPEEAAFTMASALVDPAEVRGQIDPKQPLGHLQTIQTPDGNMLLAQPARAWTHMISGDGGNGRSRYTLQTNVQADGVRPWPIPRHHKPAIVDYHCSSLKDMAEAVRASAQAIRSPDLITQISTNPRGVWNPPVVVLARAYEQAADGSVTVRWFLHTVEGSTRVEACHDLSEVDAAAPLLESHDPLAHLRAGHKAYTDRFEETPTAFRSLAAARAATMPVLIVVAAVENDMVTPITGGFPAIINDYVESVHVQPRPFSDVAQSNVLGERFVLRLEAKGAMSREDAEAILGRGEVTGLSSVRAAKLVHAVCDAANDDLVREFMVTEPGSRLTKVKRAKLIGPLVVRQFTTPAESAERALMRAFTPDLLMEPWSVTGVDSKTLRKTCLADLEAGNSATPAIAELMARGGPALCTAGLLLSDQGSTVQGIPNLRGSVDKVVEELATTPGGIHVLADAIAWADGDSLAKPREFTPDGIPKKDKHGDQLHFPTSWQKGNMGIRALAFTNGEIPTSQKNKGQDKPPTLTPEQKYQEAETALLRNLKAADTMLKDLVAATDEHGKKLLAKIGLKKDDVYEEFPGQLMKIYARYGNEDDVLSSFDEDELPDDTTILDHDEDNLDDEETDDDTGNH